MRRPRGPPLPAQPLKPAVLHPWDLLSAQQGFTLAHRCQHALRTRLDTGSPKEHPCSRTGISLLSKAAHGTAQEHQQLSEWAGAGTGATGIVTSSRSGSCRAQRWSRYESDW